MNKKPRPKTNHSELSPKALHNTPVKTNAIKTGTVVILKLFNIRMNLLPSCFSSGKVVNFSINSEPDEKATTSHIMQAVGLTVWVNQEPQIDAVTAVSGSGPAYYFLMMEAMIQGAEKLGLSTDIAQQLVLQTAAGAAKMAQQSSQTPAQLRQAVTSPKGTTEQAINTFNDGGFNNLCDAAMAAAHHRSQELAQLFKP